MGKARTHTTPLPRSCDAKRERLLELLPLPEYDWNWFKAGVAAGYSPKYADTTLRRTCMADARFTKALQERMQESKAETEDMREKCQQKLLNMADRDDIRPTELARVVEVLGKMNGWMSETLIVETSQRRAELDQAQRRLAQRTAQLLLSTSDGPRPAPDDVYDAQVISRGPAEPAEPSEPEPAQSV